MLEMVLASSLIATIITVLFQYITNKKSDNLKYITNERSQWRKELRSIAEEVQNANQQNIKSALVKLRMRINAYGISNPNDYLRDGHLWLVMTAMGEEDSIEEFELHKELLITFISLLLKQDWERAKEEVKGNIIDVLLVIIYLGLIGYLTYFNFFVCKLGFEIQTLDMILVIGLEACLLHRTIYRKLCKNDYDKLFKDEKDFRDFGLSEKEIKKVLLKSMIGHLGIGIIFTIIIVVSYSSKINMASYGAYVYIIVIISLIAVFLEIMKALRMYNNFRDYIHSVVLAWDFYFAKYDALVNKREENANQN